MTSYYDCIHRQAEHSQELGGLHCWLCDRDCWGRDCLSSQEERDYTQPAWLISAQLGWMETRGNTLDGYLA